MNRGKRHNWVKDKRSAGRCTDCGMTRHHETARKRAGYYGRRVYDVTVYRNRKGGQVWTPSLGNKVPGPCRPPHEPAPEGVELVCGNCYATPYPYQREGDACHRCHELGARIGRVDP